MAQEHLPSGHPAVPRPKIGVLLLNLGTPDGTDYRSMRRYLSEFLSDRRVIDYSPWLWQPLLQLVILTRRPKKSGEAYRAIWNEERDESPLRTVTRSQAEKLAAVLEADGPDLVVDWAMRYGNPSTDLVLRRLADAGCDRIVAMALYPQYAAPTTATAYDKVFESLMKMRRQPALRTMGPYHDHPTYIRLLAESVRTHLAGLGDEPQKLVVSYHGLPERYLMEGDPYHCMCQKTSRLLCEELGWPGARLLTVFQSRFGREEWLKPYLDETLEALPREGVKRIAVISPAFVADCVETLEEIDQQGREQFMAAGGTSFSYVPCLNDGEAHVAFLADLARRELAGWT
ncbi:MAG: ferrochelatase [Geminicoccaceae bacterium]|nr:ferrochelatase [Geminicoccaceae bacterium]